MLIISGFNSRLNMYRIIDTESMLIDLVSIDVLAKAEKQGVVIKRDYYDVYYKLYIYLLKVHRTDSKYDNRYIFSLLRKASFIYKNILVPDKLYCLSVSSCYNRFCICINNSFVYILSNKVFKLAYIEPCEKCLGFYAIIHRCGYILNFKFAYCLKTVDLDSSCNILSEHL